MDVGARRAYASLAMKVFHCDHCGNLLFFENVTCVRCGRALAYLPWRADLVSLEPDPTPGSFRARTGDRVRLCSNYVTHQVCNWALPAEASAELCAACELTRTIPDLSAPGNQRLWYELEVAKRRLLFTLMHLGLPVRSLREDPERGLAFDFVAGGSTGHADGVITVALEEADDATRVKRRLELGEPTRTLLGHLRHESGHYYWTRLVEEGGPLEAFREAFGDERADYAEAKRRHYAEGAPAGWQDRFVSAYATMHPWEDWAESWAHYLHMVDTLETGAAVGISVRPRRSDEPAVVNVPDPTRAGATFEWMMESWRTLTYVLDSLNRGLGNDDAYPFVLSPPAVAKLRFVHDLVGRDAQPWTKMPER